MITTPKSTSLSNWGDLGLAKQKIEACITEIHPSVSINYLKLNEDNADFIILSTKAGASLTDGTIPEAMECAIVSPLLKEANLDHECLKTIDQ